MSNCDNGIDVVTKTLENDSMELINWFSLNLMKANSDKFQAIAIGKKTKSQNLSFNLSGNKIVCEDNVKLLGVTIDSDLNFDNHISEMCKKASRQLNISKRIGKYMNRLGRLTSYYSFLFRSEFFFPDNTRVRIFFFFVGQSATFFPEFNIRLYDKNSESDYFCFPPPKSEYFFRQHKNNCNRNF